MEQKQGATINSRLFGSEDANFIVKEVVKEEDYPACFLRLVCVMHFKPSYNLALSNCEHLASFIATGKWHSDQVSVDNVSQKLDILFKDMGIKIEACKSNTIEAIQELMIKHRPISMLEVAASSFCETATSVFSKTVNHFKNQAENE